MKPNLGQQIKMNPTSHLLAAFGGVIATSLLVVIILGRVIVFLHEGIKTACTISGIVLTH